MNKAHAYQLKNAVYQVPHVVPLAAEAITTTHLAFCQTLKGHVTDNDVLTTLEAGSTRFWRCGGGEGSEGVRGVRG